MSTGNYTDWSGLLQTANSVTNGAWGALLPFVVGLIAFSYYSRYGAKTGFSAATFTAFIIALPLYASGITSGYIIVILMVLTAIGAFLVWRG